MAKDETKPATPQDPGKSRDERLAQVLARCADRLNAGEELKIEEILGEVSLSGGATCCFSAARARRAAGKVRGCRFSLWTGASVAG